jgi:hypothetical protein
MLLKLCVTIKSLKFAMSFIRKILSEVTLLDQMVKIKFDEYMASQPRASDFIRTITQADVILAFEFIKFHFSELVNDLPQHQKANILSTSKQMDQYFQAGLEKKKQIVKVENQNLKTIVKLENQNLKTIVKVENQNLKTIVKVENQNLKITSVRDRSSSIKRSASGMTKSHTKRTKNDGKKLIRLLNQTSCQSSLYQGITFYEDFFFNKYKEIILKNSKNLLAIITPIYAKYKQKVFYRIYCPPIFEIALSIKKYYAKYHIDQKHIHTENQELLGFYDIVNYIQKANPQPINIKMKTGNKLLEYHMDNSIDYVLKGMAKTSVNSGTISYSIRMRMQWLFIVLNKNNAVLTHKFNETYIKKIYDKFGVSWANFTRLATKRHLKITESTQALMSNNNLSYRRAVLRSIGIEFAGSLKKWVNYMVSEDENKKKLGLALTILSLSGSRGGNVSFLALSLNKQARSKASKIGLGFVKSDEIYLSKNKDCEMINIHMGSKGGKLVKLTFKSTDVISKCLNSLKALEEEYLFASLGKNSKFQKESLFSEHGVAFFRKFLASAVFYSKLKILISNEELITPQVRKEIKDLLENFNFQFTLETMTCDISKILHHTDFKTILFYVDIDLVYEFWFIFVKDQTILARNLALFMRKTCFNQDFLETFKIQRPLDTHYFFYNVKEILDSNFDTIDQTSYQVYFFDRIITPN